LPAHPFGFLTHLGEGAPLLDRKLDQLRKLLFERAQGGVYRGDVFGAEVQGYQVLAHRNSPRGGQETQEFQAKVWTNIMTLVKPGCAIRALLYKDS
jgi:hypothetical protein